MLPLHDAAKEGNLEAVQELLAGTYIDVNLVDNSFGKTPLRWAVEYGQLDVAKLLLDHGARSDLADTNGRTPLLWAARHGKTRKLQFLLDNDDSLSYKDSLSRRDKNRRTALSLAAIEGHIDAMKLLNKCGSEVNSKDFRGQTPLSLAAMNGHLEAVLLLLDEGADPESRETSSGRSPLSLAAENGHLHVVNLLVTRNCDVDCSDASGRTPLSWAAENGNEEVVHVLLAGGADVNSKDEDTRTPLSYASEFGHTSAAEMLLHDKTIEYDLQDTYYGQTPLSWAAEGGRYEIVNLLLEMGADACMRDRAGCTPLLWAIRNGHKDIVDLLLLDQEVDGTAVDEENWSPVSLAAHLGDKYLTQRLLSKAVELDSKIRIGIAEAIEDALWRAHESLSSAQEELHRARGDPAFAKDPSLAKFSFFPLSDSEKKRAEIALTQAKDRLEAQNAIVVKHQTIVNLIIENDDYVNATDYNGRTLLSWAAGNGHEAVFRILLSRKLDPNSIDQLGRTPISWAAKGGHVSTVIALLDEKVHPDWRDGAGRTPLSLAAENGRAAVVKLLLDIDGNLATRFYALPLNVKKKPARLLPHPPHCSSADLDLGNDKLKNGVNFDSQDYSGWTPLLYATKEGHGNVVRLLLEVGANIDIKGADNKSLWQVIEDEIRSLGADKSKATNLQDVQISLESRRADGQLLTAPVEVKASVDSKFKATVVHFLPKGKRDMLCRTYSVLDLLKGNMRDEVEAELSVTCKWLHVPANNVGPLGARLEAALILCR
jgi:ankyrin repeat protein